MKYIIIIACLFLVGCGTNTVTGTIESEATLVSSGLINEVSLPIETTATCRYKTAREISIKFNEESEKYTSYTKAKNFCFATRVTIDGDYFGYYDVRRNKSGGVSNDMDLDLNGCIPGRYIPKDKRLGAFTLREGETERFALKEFGYEFKQVPNNIQKFEVSSSSIKEGINLIDYKVEKKAYCQE